MCQSIKKITLYVSIVYVVLSGLLFVAIYKVLNLRIKKPVEVIVKVFDKEL